MTTDYSICENLITEVVDDDWGGEVAVGCTKGCPSCWNCNHFTITTKGHAHNSALNYGWNGYYLSDKYIPF